MVKDGTAKYESNPKSRNLSKRVWWTSSKVRRITKSASQETKHTPTRKKTKCRCVGVYWIIIQTRTHGHRIWWETVQHLSWENNRTHKRKSWSPLQKQSGHRNMIWIFLSVERNTKFVV